MYCSATGPAGTRYVRADGGSRLAVLVPEGSAPSAFSTDGTQLLLRRFRQRGGDSDLVIARVVRTDSGLSVEDRREDPATPNSEFRQERSLPTASGSPTCRT